MPEPLSVPELLGLSGKGVGSAAGSENKVGAGAGAGAGLGAAGFLAAGFFLAAFFAFFAIVRSYFFLFGLHAMLNSF
jgi:hypothetical protein